MFTKRWSWQDNKLRESGSWISRLKGRLNKPVGAFIVHLFCYSIAIKETRHAGEPVTIARRVANMKGYTTAQGYMGYVDGSYMLFASEDDYLEYVEG